MRFEASMAGVCQRIVFRLITLCRNVSSDVSEGRRAYTFRFIFVQVETEVSSGRKPGRPSYGIIPCSKILAILRNFSPV